MSKYAWISSVAVFTLILGVANGKTINAANSAERTEPLGTWNLYGSILVQGEYRDSKNNFAGFGNNKKDGFAELDVRFSREISPYYRWDGSFFGAYDRSDFRGQKSGAIPERFYLRGQRGDVKVPWRVEFGDYFAFTSLRSLQSPLKGARVELQYSPDQGDVFHSGQFFAGSRVRDYIEFTSRRLDDNFLAGYSHLVEFGKNGSILVSGFFTHSELNSLNADAGQFSVAVEKGFSFLDHHLTVEAEVAAITGETIQGAAVVDDTDFGYFTRISGYGGAGWRYSAQYEDYGKNYRPTAASVIADRRSYEARVGKRFSSGIDGEVRYQYSEDAKSTANPIETNTIGAVLGWASLPFLNSGSASLNTFWRQVESANGSTSHETWSADLQTSWVINPKWTATTRLFGLIFDSNQALLFDRKTLQLDASVTRNVNIGDISGSISPGVVIRKQVNGPQDIFAIGPRLSANLFHQKGHSLSFDMSVLYQDGSGGAIDKVDFNGGVRYAYTTGNHRFGVEANYLSNDPGIGTFGSAYRIMANYTYRFAVPAASQEPATDGGSKFVSYREGDLFADDFPDLASIHPGSGIGQTVAKMQARGYGNGIPIGSQRVFDGIFLKGLGQRQRLVLTAQGRSVGKTSLIVNFAAGRDPSGQARTFARIVEKFIQHYGSPERTIDEGVFTANLAADIASGRFRRIVEWKLRGGILRFGIPKRLDGQVRMEAQFAASHPNIGQLLWSIQEVR